VSEPLLIVVTGPPASGKTTIAEAIAADLALPLVAKDEIKEALADALGEEPPSGAVFAILYRFVDLQLRVGGSVVAEANFDPDLATPILADLRRRHAFRLIQIFATGDADLLADRYRERARSGERHPVHADDEQADEVEARIRAGEWRPLELEGELVEFDTTAGDVDVDALVARVRDLSR
jgi:predicted kinase